MLHYLWCVSFAQCVKFGWIRNFNLEFHLLVQNNRDGFQELEQLILSTKQANKHTLCTMPDL